MQNGAKFRSLRKKSGFTQKDLADAVEVHFTTVSQWEQQRLAISEDRMPALAAAFGIAVSQFRDQVMNQAADFTSPKDVIAIWRDRVAEADLAEGVRFLLMCLPVFVDAETRVAATTVEDFSARLHLDEDRVRSDWPAMLETEFVERIGTAGVSDQVLKLRFP